MHIPPVCGQVLEENLTSFVVVSMIGWTSTYRGLADARTHIPHNERLMLWVSPLRCRPAYFSFALQHMKEGLLSMVRNADAQGDSR